ncbi:uncharacterized protein LOC135386304 [Ornithodoros turicata]|uniref:uncharacterized protein LOC135386304 n=1 Tax=Ornithodoros turicata TaxID=34597 RepID=UPI00313A083D
MTQRKPPIVSSCSPSERNAGDSYAANGKLPPDYSLQVAFGELQHHLRQSRSEIERLNRQRVKLAAEVEAKNISLDFLQQELEKKDKERHDLQVKLMQSTQENEDLQMRLSMAAESRDTTLGYMTYPGRRRFSPAVFKHQVELGQGDAVESWEGVSQHLLSQMYKEMTELQELGKKLALDGTPLEDSTTTSDPSPSSRDVVEAENDAEEEDEDVALDIVSTLASQLKAVKDRLIEQRKSLLAVTQNAGEVSQKARSTSGRGALSPAKDDCTRSRLPLPNRRLSRHSADVPHPPGRPSTKAESIQCATKPRPQHLPQERRKDHVCPICETCFPATIAQEEFENHVLQHLAV